MIRQGKDKEELLHVLEELDSYTNIDNVLTHGQNVTIRCARHNGKLCNWSIEEELTTKEIVIDKNTGYDTFLEALEDNIQNTQINENISILCYSYAEAHRTYDGKIKTRWIVINPAIPFETDSQGMPVFPMLNLDLTDGEYKTCMQSKLALYDEFSENIYPIMEIAFSSIGKLLDSAASFKNMARIPLGSALLLAERFGNDLKKLQLIFRNAHGNIKPLIGIAGDRFARYEEKKFFEDAFKEIDSMFMMNSIGKWKITDELSTANVYVSSITEYKKGLPSFADYMDFPVFIRVQTSDIPGVSASVSAFAIIGGYTIFIHKNSAYRWQKFKDATAKSLFYRKKARSKKDISLKEDIDAFVDKINRLKEHQVLYDENVTSKIEEIKKVIGKRLMADKEDKVNAAGQYGILYNGYQLLERILSATYITMPDKQANVLYGKYGELVSVLVENIKK